MTSTATTITMSFTALVLSGVAMWRAESHAGVVSPRAATATAPVTPVSVTVAPMPAPAPVAAPAPEAAPTRAARVEVRSPAGALSVSRIEVGTGVERREAVGHAAEYELSPGQRFCAVVEVVNRGAPGAVRVRFEPEGERARSVGLVRLPVPSAPRYRTWGCTERLQAPGTWSAVVETLGGRELAREVFTVR